MAAVEDLSQFDSSVSDQEINLDKNIIISSSTFVQNDSCEEKLVEDDSEYFAQFSCPDDSDDDLDYFYHDNNDELYINNHLHGKQLDLVDKFEEKNYHRSKRSNKKINAQRQIKTKYAQSIKFKSHNKQLYMHFRLVKKVHLDPPSDNFRPSPPPVPLYSPEPLRPIISERCHKKPVSNTPNKIQPVVPQPTTHQFREYTINEQNIPNESSFDDAMITFLLEMQNRDLSPEDYEMLLRLDERVQRKTMDANILNTLPTINVNETHLTDQCSICMDGYILGQQLKLLPCTHIFHLNCIETYLKDFSIQCPLDNLPLI